jgi:ferritin-like metal-binding protein YciE
MGMFTGKKMESLKDLFIDEIEDLYDAEKRLVDALPKMADAASTPQLQQAFREHLAETEQHVKRLEQVFSLIGKEAERETCDAMKGLISEGEDVVNADGNPSIIDAALIAAAQRVEHYEMAGYGSTRNFAQQLGLSEAADLLQQTLDEEGAADKKLTDIAEATVNPKAA